MKPSSAKAKGRILQQWVRDQLLALFPSLEPDDIKSTSMGAGGEDVQLSPAARKLIPHKIECKNLASSAVYKLYEQAVSHQSKGEPLLVLKANRKKPLAIMDAEYYFNLLKRLND